jgi:hypothetical protein
MIATLVLMVFVGWAVWQRPVVQYRAVVAVRVAAGQHWGHVATQGWVYTLLDPRFYDDRGEILTMRRDETLRFLVRALVSYVMVPVPWSIRSTATLVYLPAQMLWYVLVLLIVPGVVVGFRRDALVTCLLVSCGGVAALLVALTEGNVGTLVRHRDLALPYFVWLSATGAAAVVAWLTSPRHVKAESHAISG